jgi:hypothetical protein
VHLPRATRPREYWALNVIGLLDAADLESSEGTMLQEHDGRPTRIAFSRLTLSRARTLGVPMFRLAQDPSLVLVSDRIVEALDDRRPPEGWGFATVELEMTGG